MVASTDLGGTGSGAEQAERIVGLVQPARYIQGGGHPDGQQPDPGQPPPGGPGARGTRCRHLITSASPA